MSRVDLDFVFPRRRVQLVRKRIPAYEFERIYVLTVKEKDPNVTGVVTHSSGNHGQALAWAAKMAKLPCTVVVPNNFSAVKVEAIKGYGAELVLCEPTPASRQETCDRVGKEKSFTFIPPYDHYDVIAGQGTMAVEFLKQVPDLDAILVPVSGGGMISGIAIAAKTIKPDIKVFMVEPEGKMAEESLRAGERLWPDPPGFLNTIADGIRLQQLGHITWPIILELVEKDVFSVSDEEMIKGMQFTFQRMKLVIEAASGAGVAAVMSEKMATMDPSIKNIGVILCGGNVDINNLPWYKI
ncbi:hypothetical protein FSP39_019483 [Pinctada imbricata]|uniref:Serine racemase n=1 Tax=Pinctada imbricata TaxID=66713 RepID=A0AA88XHY0_PINIB|nr:hypothetical protein FSP39_019483 [Pinctada imbricata]